MLDFLKKLWYPKTVLVLILALYMIVQGSKQLTLLRNEETTNGNS